MRLRKIEKEKGLYLDIIESYRKNGKPTIRSIMTIGYLKDSGHDLAYFENMVKEMNLKKKEEKKTSLAIDMNETLSIGNELRNVGYFALKYIYNELGLNELFTELKRRSKIDYSLNKNMELLTFSRILYPASKKSTFDDRKVFFEGFAKDVTKDSIYDCLDVFSRYKEKIEKLIFDNTKDKY